MLSTFVVENELVLRLSFFFGIFTLMATWELIVPKRKLLLPKLMRWKNNIGLVFLNSLLMRLFVPMTTVAVALYAQENHLGLFNQLSIPPILTILICIVIMDLVIYLQHVLVHIVPFLWRLHRVHHVDQDYDVTTGARFHPLEIFLSLMIKFVTIIILGPPIVAVILFEIILNMLAMFNHGNVGLPKMIDSVVRWFIVSPDMHRIHHSIEVNETNSNYGFNLSCWDRIFKTYCESPKAGEEQMTIGVKNYTDVKQTNNFKGMLILPFQK